MINIFIQMKLSIFLQQSLCVLFLVPLCFSMRLRSEHSEAETKGRLLEEISALESAATQQALTENLIPQLQLKKQDCESMSEQDRKEVIDKVRESQKSMQHSIDDNNSKNLTEYLQNSLFYLENLRETLESECENDLIIASSAFVSNLNAKNWVLGSLPFREIGMRYVLKSHIFKNLTICPLDKPFSDWKECLSCQDRQLFNLESRRCELCPYHTRYNAATHICQLQAPQNGIHPFQPVTVEPIEAPTKPAPTSPVPVKPIPTKPVTVEPIEAPTKPAPTQPAPTQPVQTKPVTVKPIEGPTIAVEPIAGPKVSTKPTTVEPIVASNKTASFQRAPSHSNPKFVNRIIFEQGKDVSDYTASKEDIACPAPIPFFTGKECILCKASELYDDNKKACGSCPAEKQYSEQTHSCH